MWQQTHRKENTNKKTPSKLWFLTESKRQISSDEQERTTLEKFSEQWQWTYKMSNKNERKQQKWERATLDANERQLHTNEREHRALTRHENENIQTNKRNFYKFKFFSNLFI